MTVPLEARASEGTCQIAGRVEMLDGFAKRSSCLDKPRDVNIAAPPVFTTGVRERYDAQLNSRRSVDIANFHQCNFIPRSPNRIVQYQRRQLQNTYTRHVRETDPARCSSAVNSARSCRSTVRYGMGVRTHPSLLGADFILLATKNTWDLGSVLHYETHSSSEGLAAHAVLGQADQDAHIPLDRLPEPPGHDKQSPGVTFLWPEDASSDTYPDVRLNASESKDERPMPEREAERGRKELETETPRNQGPTEMSEQRTEREAEEGETKTPTAMAIPKEKPPQEHIIHHRSTDPP
ncbi:hypothetical protein NDU88_004353 [Pleurodeles waltl]|uniref:Uncharacterized protein n=1 Tax=Pleurodeles waltl TaxID=8319 RepID=A0AAV7UF17_PLEWA|nr:hypothetical protein NDU88_004353 [Pleurodeles waltl]